MNICLPILTTKLTESPPRNIFLRNLSLWRGLGVLLSYPALVYVVHISWTSSSTMLRCLSKALTLPSNFWLLWQLISTCVWFLTDSVRMLRGPVESSSRFLASHSSVVIFLPCFPIVSDRTICPLSMSIISVVVPLSASLPSALAMPIGAYPFV